MRRLSKEMGALVRGSWGSQIIEELTPHEGDHLVIKKGYGGFFSDLTRSNPSQPGYQNLSFKQNIHQHLLRPLTLMVLSEQKRWEKALLDATPMQ